MLIHAIEPRVAIMNNGTRKGGQPAVMKVMYTAPRLEDLWQLHASQLSGQEYTVPGLFVANHWDRPQLAMPIAPLEPAGRGPGAPPAHDGPALDQSIGSPGRLLRDRERPQRLLQDLHTESHRVKPDGPKRAIGHEPLLAMRRAEGGRCCRHPAVGATARPGPTRRSTRARCCRPARCQPPIRLGDGVGDATVFVAPSSGSASPTPATQRSSSSCPSLPCQATRSRWPSGSRRRRS